MLRFSLFCIFLLLSVQGIYAQQSYAKTILDSLCSPEYDGRGYVNQGDNRAAAFIVRELQNIGVQPFKKNTYSQPYFLNVNTFPTAVSVIMDQDTLKPGVDYLVDPSSGSASGNYELVEINSSNYVETYHENIDLSTQERDRRIYAFNFTDITEKDKKNKLRGFAYKAMHYFPVIWVETNKQMYGVGRQAFNFPLITIDSADYRPAKNVTLNIKNVYNPHYQTQNVIGLIPGKKKRKYIVLSAHFDHLGRMGAATYFPGANDNASGVAMLLSLAKYYIQNKPEYSIVFCFFSGEEAGLEGSKYFVQHPWFKLKKVNFVLNIDIMGSAEDGITVVNGTEHAEAFDQLVKINEQKNYLNLVKKRGPTANSDHYFFAQSGVPAFFVYSMGSVKNYHDIYDKAENTPLTKFDAVQSLMIDFISAR